MNEITIKISRDGSKVEVDADGFTGQSCENYKEKIVESIGTLSDSGRKPEFYEQGGVNLGS